MNVCLSCDSPGNLGGPRLSPPDSWDRLQQTPVTQKWKEAATENGQMELLPNINEGDRLDYGKVNHYTYMSKYLPAFCEYQFYYCNLKVS